MSVEEIPFLSASDLAVGDVVEFIAKYEPKWAGRPFRVEKVLQRNVDLIGEDGSTVRADPFLLMKSTRPFTAPTGPRLVLGSLVRFSAPNLIRRYGTSLYTVTTPPRAGKVKVALLGGDENRYISIATAAVVWVDPKDVLR